MIMETQNIDNKILYKPETVVHTYANQLQYDDTDKKSPQFTSQDTTDYKREVLQVSAFDVAAYILQKIGCCSTMKLHKLLYYCQAWSLVWDEHALFNEKIEAWANGPVVHSVFTYHKGLFSVNSNDFLIGNPNMLSTFQKETVDNVLAYYGNKSAQWLINLTHMEKPWKEARVGLEPMERGNKEITHSAMAEYYSSL